MGNWGHFEFNVPYNGESIESVNGIELSKQYLEFMREHNGGEGDIGETWLVLFPLEELEEINYDYEIEKYLPGHIIIGSDGGGELYGIDENGRFFNVPVMIEAECVTYFGTNIEILPDEINAFWSEQVYPKIILGDGSFLIMQMSVLLDDFEKANLLLDGENSSASKFGLIRYYDEAGR